MEVIRLEFIDKTQASILADRVAERHTEVANAATDQAGWARCGVDSIATSDTDILLLIPWSLKLPPATARRS
jgi:hypothetical protein